MSITKNNRDFMMEAIKEMEKSIEDIKVGAVIVKDGEIISRGYRSSDSHAERNAIESALKNGIKLKGSILFTTLEPCIRTSKNPRKESCCEFIKKAGISTVFIGSYDPNSTINRKGWNIYGIIKLIGRIFILICVK